MTENPSRREEAIAAAVARARAGWKRLYAYDDSARTYEVVIAKRESQKYDRGELKLPPTAKAVCVEGDTEWTPLPDWIPTAVEKATDSAKRRSDRARLQSARPVRHS